MLVFAREREKKKHLKKSMYFDHLFSNTQISLVGDSRKSDISLTLDIRVLHRKRIAFESGCTRMPGCRLRDKLLGLMNI